MTERFDLFTFNRLLIFLAGVGATVATQWLWCAYKHRPHTSIRPVGILVGTAVILFGLMQNLSLADEVRKCLIESGHLASQETEATTRFLVAINNPPTKPVN